MLAVNDTKNRRNNMESNSFQGENQCTFPNKETIGLLLGT